MDVSGQNYDTVSCLQGTEPPVSSGLGADFSPTIVLNAVAQRDLILQVIEPQSLVPQQVALTICH